MNMESLIALLRPPSISEGTTPWSTVQPRYEIFYRKAYEHPWLSRFFQAVPEEHIRKQQTDFIVGAIGGPKLYAGRLAKDAHVHMFIGEDLCSLRQSLLIEALEEAEAPESLREQWLNIDDSFKRGMVKQSIGQCRKRFASDKILSFEESRSA